MIEDGVSDSLEILEHPRGFFRALRIPEIFFWAIFGRVVLYFGGLLTMFIGLVRIFEIPQHLNFSEILCDDFLEILQVWFLDSLIALSIWHLRIRHLVFCQSFFVLKVHFESCKDKNQIHREVFEKFQYVHRPNWVGSFQYRHHQYWIIIIEHSASNNYWYQDSDDTSINEISNHGTFNYISAHHTDTISWFQMIRLLTWIFHLRFIMNYRYDEMVE